MRTGSPLTRALTKPSTAVAVVPRLLASPDSSSEDLMELSERMRVAGASAIMLRGSALQQVQVLLEEQRRALGNYPGPLPVLFEPADGILPEVHQLSGLAAVVLPHPVPAASPAPVLIVPRCEKVVDYASALEVPEPPPILFATDEATTTDGSGSSERLSASTSIQTMASLPLSRNLAQEARNLRASGCSAAVLDFDVDDWPSDPEMLVRTAMSKRSSVVGSVGIQTAGLAGTFSSDQYWLNKKFKEARALGDKREKQYGSRETRDGFAGGGGGNTGGEAGSSIPRA